MSALLRKTAAIAGQVRSPIKSSSISLRQSIRLFSFKSWQLVQPIKGTYKVASLFTVLKQLLPSCAPAGRRQHLAAPFVVWSTLMHATIEV
jgi:hypothetical protein